MNDTTWRMRFRATILLSTCALVLTSCTSLGSSGPNGGDVRKAANQPLQNTSIKVVELTAPIASRVLQMNRSAKFSEALGEGTPIGTIIGRGDTLDVAIWEAPPAALFGTVITDSRLASATTVARGSSLPEQMVDANGQINIPFAGKIAAAGRTPTQVEQDIVRRLVGKAHDPQAVVRLVRNTNTNVTVIGDVASSMRIPLSPKGERLLDVLASAGGVKQPVGKMTIQVTRGSKVVTMPLEGVIKDPHQNIRLQPDDVVTALYQPYSFTALGAIANNAEINFEGTGITLAQALGRVGGLRDDRANVRGVFIFRLEDPAALDPAMLRESNATPDGKIPVIYRVDLKNPASFFIAQDFPLHNKDVLYVSNAPGVDLQKFVNIVSQMAFSVISIGNAIN